MARKLYTRKFQEAGKDVYDKYGAGVKQNPSKSDIKNLLAAVPEGHLPSLRAILHNDLYAWAQPELLHEYVIEHQSLPRDSATLEFDFSESPVAIRLSATNAKINKLGSLPHEKQAELVMTSPHIEAIFGKYEAETGMTSGSGQFKARFSD